MPRYWQNGGNVVQDGKIVLVPEGSAAIADRRQSQERGHRRQHSGLERALGSALQSGKIASVVMGGWMLGNLETLIDPDGAGNWRVTTAPGGAFSNGGTYIQIPQLAAAQGSWPGSSPNSSPRTPMR